MNLRDERGINLVEVLMVMVFSLVILGATIQTYVGMLRGTDEDMRRNQAAETARNALDLEVRQLRNLAQRVSHPVIDRVEPYDFIFQTSDPTRTWVRYCLDALPDAEHGRLWEATWSTPVGNQDAAVQAGMRATCPGTGWTLRTVVAEDVVNTRAGMDRPVFSYSCTTAGSDCTTDAALHDRIVTVASTLYIDTTPALDPPEQKVSSSVFLRNQNQAPVAKFDTTTSGSRTVILNASGSTDYEGRTLGLYWFKGTIPAAADIRCDQPLVTLDSAERSILWGGVTIGHGMTLSHQFPVADGAAGSSLPIALVACDPGGRFSIDGPRSVVIPS